jgi:hypothetical protein
MIGWSEKRRVAWLAFAAGVLLGCSSAPAIPGVDLAIGADPSGTKRRSPSTSDDAPEGQTQASTELQGTTPPGATPPASDKGEDGAGNDASAPAPGPTPAPAAPCAADGDCDYGTICVAALCIAGCYTSADCPASDSCIGGMCKTAAAATPVGMTCISDGQCNPGGNGAGQICGAQGSCVPGCRLDNQCPGVHVCASGVCK